MGTTSSWERGDLCQKAALPWDSSSRKQPEFLENHSCSVIKKLVPAGIGLHSYPDGVGRSGSYRSGKIGRAALALIGVPLEDRNALLQLILATGSYFGSSKS
ncbi:uncharacterized protein VTP21DRAFT_1345 [Calcarisporiella thermophila]|uniref:uncharacterized protein n=1 Tax=Calcarisporiella thermophila TaxID=911321 RepID=UPI003742B878